MSSAQPLTCSPISPNLGYELHALDGSLTTVKYGYSELERRFVEENPRVDGYAFVGVTDRFLDEYYRQRVTCISCPGVARCEWHGDRVVPIIADDLRHVAIGISRCKASAEASSRATFERAYAAAGLPRRLRDFPVTDVDGRGNAVVLTGVKDAIQHHRSLFIVGTSGSGKSLMVTLAARRMIGDGRLVRYISAPALISKLHSAIKDSDMTVSKVLLEYSAADVLILEDVGHHSYTAWDVEQLFTLISNRYDGDRQTLMTSAYSLTNLGIRMSVAGVVADSFVSRVMDYCVLLELAPINHRVEKRLSNL